MVARTCSATRAEGEHCRAAPLRDRPFCLMHDPEHAEVVAEARRLGGARRKREATLAGAYDLDGVETVEGLRRIIEIVIADALGVDNSIARGRLLLAAVQVAAKVLEVGELEDRILQVEAALGPRLVQFKGRRR